MENKAEKITMVDIDLIQPNPENPNEHSEEQIARLEKIIIYSGFREPLIVSKRTGFLNAGEGRLMAAKNLGMKMLPVMYQDFNDEAQEYAHLTATNEVARWSVLNKDKVLEAIKEFEFEDIEVLGLEFDFVSCADLDLDAELENAGIDSSEDLTEGTKKAIQIEFNLEHYEEAQELITWWRKEGAYIGEMMISFLREERVKHEESGIN